MHVSNGMSRAASMVRLSVDECVCVNVCAWTWKSVLVILVNSHPYLLLSLACSQYLFFFVAQPSDGFLSQKLACWNINECMLFLLKFHQTVGGANVLGQAVRHCLEGICLKYYLPFDINPILHILPNLNFVLR